MVQSILKGFPKERRPEGHLQRNHFLRVSEFYYDTIQGEGPTMGVPAAFLRLQGCILNCTFCDTQEVWRHGNPYTFNELFDLMEHTNILSKFQMGQHLVITGGSPLLQQNALGEFLRAFGMNYGFMPYVEVENECVIRPTKLMLDYVQQWNNSPKLESSGLPLRKRYRPEVLHVMSRLTSFQNWFKFVISDPVRDIQEIKDMFIFPLLIRPDQVILMPEGQTREELEIRRPIVIELAVENGFRYSTREHIQVWDKKVGV